MNLLDEHWIPVRRASGERLWIAPHQITDGVEHDPIVALDAVRPDFNGALIQFLIGLVQTAWARAGKSFERETMLWEPPSPESLKEYFAPLKEAFELDGHGPRFMQDVSVARDPDRIEKSISSQLIDAPGEETRRSNTDHFLKAGLTEQLCSDCAAAALLTIQTNSPKGGRGILVSLRGGGPLTTLIKFMPADALPAALWRDIASNILPSHSFLPPESGTPDQAHQIFPWLGIPEKLAPTATVQPLDVHPAQVFWGMPRRLWLDSTKTQIGGCECCGRADKTLLTTVYSRPDGLRYEGPWRHPLSPYYEKARGQWLCVHPQPGGLGYTYWLGAVLGGMVNRTRVIRARVVEAHLHSTTSRGTFALWAFGYDMSDAKARCWYEATYPLFDIDQADRLAQEVVAQLVQWLIAGSSAGVDYLKNAVRDVLFDPASQRAWGLDQRKKVNAHLRVVENAFWSRTERAFFDHVEQAVRLARTDAATALNASQNLRERWLQNLETAVRRLFDEFAASGDVESCHPERLGEAYRALMGQLRGEKIHEALGLLKLDRLAGARRTGRSKGGSSRRKRGAPEGEVAP